MIAHIRDEIARAGRITFERFMEEALYHPKFGYYVTRRDRATRSGDFLTAPETHPLFGRVLARQLAQMWELMGRPKEFTLREYGPGTGALESAVRTGLRLDESDLGDVLQYEPVVAGERARDGLIGCAFANEVVDALPVHRVVQRGDSLRELYVSWRGDGFADEEDEPSTPDLNAYLDSLGVALVDGQQAEINLRAKTFMHAIAASLARGYVLFIDYGHDARELYDARRMHGTLLGYRGHKTVADPYQAVGEQDLTSHVDLTTLDSTARSAGLAFVGRTTQAEFLTALGLGEMLDQLGRGGATSASDYLAARAAVLRFLDPRHTGRFAVLAYGRDVPNTMLRGFGLRLS